MQYHTAEAAGMPTRVLVVDDEPSILELLAEYLEGRGWEVEVARSGREARALLDAWQFDLLLTDLKLPDTDGLEMVRLCQGLTPAVPGVLMTGFASVQSVVDALRIGALDVVLKPFRLRDVFGVLESALSRAGRLRQSEGLVRAIELLERSELAEQRADALALLSPLAEVLAGLPGARFAEVTQGRVTVASFGSPLGECAGWALPGGYRVRLEPPHPQARAYVLAVERAMRRGGV